MKKAVDNAHYSLLSCYAVRKRCNSNITALERHGVIDIVNYYSSYGLQNSMKMYYSSNRLKSIAIDAEGADYEGRTGLAASDGALTAFKYDANGNMTSDPSRRIVHIDYNDLNLPTDVYFADGHRQTISYDGFGRKLRAVYSHTSASVAGSHLPDDGSYTVTATREYVGPHIFENGELVYSGFDGGYFEPGKGVRYYITDWQGNNVKVGARNLTPYGQWPVIDPKSETFYPVSPYSYCAGDPINRVDRDGKFWDAIIDAGFLGYDIGMACYNYYKGNIEEAKQNLTYVAIDVGALLVPGATVALYRLSKNTVKYVSKTANVTTNANKSRINFKAISEGKNLKSKNYKKL